MRVGLTSPALDCRKHAVIEAKLMRHLLLALALVPTVVSQEPANFIDAHWLFSEHALELQEPFDDESGFIDLVELGLIPLVKGPFSGGGHLDLHFDVDGDVRIRFLQRLERRLDADLLELLAKRRRRGDL